MTASWRKRSRRDGSERKLGAKRGNLGQEDGVVVRDGGADMVGGGNCGRLVAGRGGGSGRDAAVVLHAAEVDLEVCEGLLVLVAKAPVATGFSEEAGLDDDVVA